MIDVTAWAPTRAAAIAFLEAAGIARLDLQTGDICPIAEVIIHPFRASESITVEATPAVLDADGNVITPAVLVGGFHFNLRFYGSSEATLTAGLPQTGGLFERTRILQLVAARTGEPPAWQETKPPIPPGYETSEGVRAFDPETIKTRRNVFA